MRYSLKTILYPPTYQLLYSSSSIYFFLIYKCNIKERKEEKLNWWWSRTICASTSRKFAKNFFPCCLNFFLYFRPHEIILENKEDKNTNMYMPLIKASKSICEMNFLKSNTHICTCAEGTERNGEKICF